MFPKDAARTQLESSPSSDGEYGATFAGRRTHQHSSPREKAYPNSLSTPVLLPNLSVSTPICCSIRTKTFESG